MSWQRRLGLGGERREAAQLKAEVGALEVALARCRSVVGYCGRRRRALMAGAITLALALGVALGANLDPIGRSVSELTRSLGLAQAAADAEAAHAAYQSGGYAAALRLARPLAEAGDARAQSLVGSIHYRGRGVARNDAEALRWFRRAADQGEAEAQFHLAIMHGEGQSVPQDHAEAARWFRLAAEGGHAQAQYNLGLAYAKGEGVEQDHVRAHMWFNLAAARFAGSDSRNRGIAARSRDVIAGKMSRDDLAEAQKLAREWQPR